MCSENADSIVWRRIFSVLFHLPDFHGITPNRIVDHSCFAWITPDRRDPSAWRNFSVYTGLFPRLHSRDTSLCQLGTKLEKGKRSKAFEKVTIDWLHFTGSGGWDPPNRGQRSHRVDHRRQETLPLKSGGNPWPDPQGGNYFAMKILHTRRRNLYILGDETRRIPRIIVESTQIGWSRRTLILDESFLNKVGFWRICWPLLLHSTVLSEPHPDRP